ncbi:hypothetical protein PAEPH01_0769 [Pancytospora epiphaga]|nr:hypothetical protein PAEPH01_0769 [Pancytospora epiphaga]
MDLELISELEEVSNKENHQDTAPTGTARLLRYILTLPSISEEHMPLLMKFVRHAFEVLPSSTLPMLVSQKFGLPISRVKKVSFGEVEICTLKSGLSMEGERQRVRESKSLAITNTDPHKKFRPRGCINKGVRFQTKVVSIFDLSIRNCWNGPLRKSGIGILKFDFTVDDVISSPSLLDKYR